MSLNARKVPSTGGPKHPIMDAGTYASRVVQMLDLGLQEQRPYMGDEKPPAFEMMITYEMADDFLLDEDGKEMLDKPRWLSERIPLRSLDADKATSTKRYYALDPDEAHKGDFAKLIEAPCMVTVVHSKPSKKTGKIYNNVAAVSSMRPKEAAKAPDLVNPPKVFLLDEPDLEVFLSLPDWIQSVIKENLNFMGSELDKRLKAHTEASGDGTKEDENTDTDNDSEKEDW